MQKKLLVNEWFQGIDKTKVPGNNINNRRKKLGQTKETKTPHSIVFILRSPEGDLIK